MNFPTIFFVHAFVYVQASAYSVQCAAMFTIVHAILIDLFFIEFSSKKNSKCLLTFFSMMKLLFILKIVRRKKKTRKKIWINDEYLNWPTRHHWMTVFLYQLMYNTCMNTWYNRFKRLTFGTSIVYRIKTNRNLDRNKQTNVWNKIV